MGLKEDASITLQKAYEEALTYTNAPQCNHKEFVDYILNNTHLTFKYILFTALLSKATDPNINPLCLQKKSQLPGAYDARTVCHKVIVPFEIEVLKKALGGSNEPFLNKPARFPELSKNNPVRRGNDRKLLNSLCDNFPLIKEQEDAYQCLVYLLYRLIRIKEEKEALIHVSIPSQANLPSNLMTFINHALEKSFEGEVLTLLVAGIYHLQFNGDADFVEVHPVNESGASDKEISDLDIYRNGRLVSSNELKDKKYAENDVRHAADKVLRAGGTKMLFIEGVHAQAFGVSAKVLEAEYRKKNFMLGIIPCRQFFEVNIGMLEECNCEEFMRYILYVATETKFKEETIYYLKKLGEKVFGKSEQN